MKLIKIGNAYYNPKYITYIKENSYGELIIGHVESWGHTQNENLEETLLKLRKEEE